MEEEELGKRDGEGSVAGVEGGLSFGGDCRRKHLGTES